MRFKYFCIFNSLFVNLYLFGYSFNSLLKICFYTKFRKKNINLKDFNFENLKMNFLSFISLLFIYIVLSEYMKPLKSIETNNNNDNFNWNSNPTDLSAYGENPNDSTNKYINLDSLGNDLTKGKFDDPNFKFPSDKDFKEPDNEKYLNTTTGYKNLDLAGTYLLDAPKEPGFGKFVTKSCPRNFQIFMKNCQRDVYNCISNCDRTYRLCPNQRKEYAVCIGACDQLQIYCNIKNSLTDTCKVKCASDQCRKYCIRRCERCREICICK